MFKNSFQRRRRPRSLALLSAAVLAVAGLVTLAVPANAALTQGPANRPDGLADYFVDANGLALAPCEASAANCGGGFDPADATYFGAEALFGDFRAVYSLAGGFVPGEGLVIDQGIRITAKNIPSGAYTIRDPWGTIANRCAAVAGRMNCRIRTTNRITSFLRSATAPAGFIGNSVAETPVTGSPTGFNRIVVTGPGAFSASTGRFALTGQMLANTAMTSIATKPVKLGTLAKATPSTVKIPVTSFGTAVPTVTANLGGANPGDFTVADTCAAVGVAGTCDIVVTYTPRPNRDASSVLTITDGGLAAARRVTLTGIAPDTLAPKLLAKSPAANSTVVKPGKSVHVSFNEPVRGVGKLTFSLTNNSTGNRVGAKVSQVRKSNSYVLNPAHALARGAGYTVKLNGGRTGIRDLAGNPLTDMQWRFRTR